MYKKYKIKKRKKTNLYLIFFVIMTSFLFMSFGYSYFSDKMTIKGIANILAQDEDVGKSTYSWSIVHSWGERNRSCANVLSNKNKNYKS